MAKSITGEKIIIPEARVAFAQGLFTPGENGQFGANLILAPSSLAIQLIRNEEERLAKLAWPDKWALMLEQIRAGNNQALKPGILKAKYDGFQGNLFLSASLKTRPTLVSRAGVAVVQSDGVFYSGCYALAHVSLWTQDNEYGQKINTNLLGLQFIRDGDAFSGGAAPSDAGDFKPLDAGEDLSGALD